MKVEENVERNWSALEVALKSKDEQTRIAAWVAVLAAAGRAGLGSARSYKRRARWGEGRRPDPAPEPHTISPQTRGEKRLGR
jgi:hypothetical protein